MQATLQKFFVNKKSDGQEYLKLFLVTDAGTTIKASLWDQWYFEGEHDIRAAEGETVEFEATDVEKGDKIYTNIEWIKPLGTLWKKPEKQAGAPKSGGGGGSAAAIFQLCTMLEEQLQALNEGIYELSLRLKPKE